jgi:hypothetical protein
VWSSWWNENRQGKLKHPEKTCAVPLFPEISHTLPGIKLGPALGSLRRTARAVARPSNLDNPYMPFSLCLGQWTKCGTHYQENGQYMRFFHVCVSYRMLMLKHFRLWSCRIVLISGFQVVTRLYASYWILHEPQVECYLGRVLFNMAGILNTVASFCYRKGSVKYYSCHFRLAASHCWDPLYHQSKQWRQMLLYSVLAIFLSVFPSRRL